MRRRLPPSSRLCPLGAMVARILFTLVIVLGIIILVSIILKLVRIGIALAVIAAIGAIIWHLVKK